MPDDYSEEELRHRYGGFGFRLGPVTVSWCSRTWWARTVLSRMAKTGLVYGSLNRIE